MLFNSYEFIFLFLPITFAGFFLLGSASHRLAALWLALASLFFYGWWDPRYVLLLVGSIAFNYAIGVAIGRAQRDDAPTTAARALLVIGLVVNLAVLGYYKYTDFFIRSANELTSADWALQHVILPLGISFFTFTQVAFLVDVYRRLAREYNVVHYFLFASYFPHLIAGPILHHKQMMPQFNRAETYRVDVGNFNNGMTIFVIGLLKKVLIADQFALYANPIFGVVEQGGSVTATEAWVGALAYTFQLYFDFSAYSDMAIGLSKLFNVDLPINFNSPYKSLNIIDFWRRWHITLSTFLRDYLYFSLGGNRKGTARRYVNLMATMVLGGLWHGASWTFVFWGMLHGFYLVINHGWQGIAERANLPALPGARLASWLVTFLAVVVAWVFFRATSFDAALRLLGGAIGLSGTGSLTALAPHLADPPLQVLAWLAAGLVIVTQAPNSLEIARWLLDWRYRGGALGAAVATALVVVMLNFNKVSTFIYFNF